MALSPPAATLNTAQTADFTAVVTGTSSKTVRWKVCDANGQNCLTGGNSTSGTVVDIGTDGSGNHIGRYTAPAVLPSPPACVVVTGGCRLTLKAKLVGRKKKATAQVTLTQGVTITTTLLPNGVNGIAYNTVLSATGGTPPYTWSEPTALFDDSTGAGSGGCAGLTLDFSAGGVSGTPATGTCGPFTLRVDDSGGQFDTKVFSITIDATLGRNDSIADATFLTNGTFSASISPYADPVDANPANPDNDFYRLTAAAGATVTVELIATRDPVDSRLDSVIEILKADGTRFATCRDPGNVDVAGNLDPTPNAFDDDCVNDDIELGVITDSRLEFLVPGAGTVTFYVRVLDWRGDARPDLLYDIVISGAN